MSRNLSEEYKAIELLPAQTIGATVTGSAKDVEIYGDDSLVVADLGTFTSNPTVTITVTGSLTGTPTTYDQTLATFTAATAAGIGALRVNLSGIKNVKGVATLSGGTNPIVPVSVSLLAKVGAKSSTNNSGTLA